MDCDLSLGPAADSSITSGLGGAVAGWESRANAPVLMFLLGGGGRGCIIAGRQSNDEIKRDTSSCNYPADRCDGPSMTAQNVHTGVGVNE